MAEADIAFVAAAGAAGLRDVLAAARALGVSQPSVSKTLHHAEDNLGFRLFQLRLRIPALRGQLRQALLVG